MADPLQVTVKQGDLRGMVVKNVTGGSYFSFRGIPYAAPPVGHLRFREVLPPVETGSTSLDCRTILLKNGMGGPVVIVKQGWIRGETVKTVVEGSYISFKGIPYAAPPIGRLRFTDPQPAIPWTGIREAKEEGPKCAQIELVFEGKLIGEEDCLYLNVATTSLTGSRPVMVWIHGGGFVMGDGGSGMYSPDYLMNSDIVFVSINYRLGILGFLQLDHKEATGNMGLKDQVAALKWVKENIAQFGGDPNNVTIFGESAGSACVHYLLLSPLAKGLFHKAIIQSGVAVNPWACTPMSVDTPHRLVAALGKETTDPDEILDFLREVPVHKLLEVQDKLKSVQDTVKFLPMFRPCVDTKSQNPFMPKCPREVAADGVDVPTLMGYNSHEGVVFASGMSDEFISLLRENFDISVTHDLIDQTSPKLARVGDEIKKFYFGEKPITKEALEECIRCYGEIHFVSGMQKVLDYQSKKRSPPTYFYKFNHISPKSFSKVAYKSPIEGTRHTDSIPYLFYLAMYGDFMKIDPDSIDQVISDRFVRMWTDFAKTGNPTPKIDDLITVKWEPVTRSSKNFLIINAELSTSVNPDEDVFQLSNRVSAIIDGSQ